MITMRDRLAALLLKAATASFSETRRREFAVIMMVGIAWVHDNQDQAKAIVRGDACLLPVPGSMRGLVKEFGESESPQSMGFGTKH